MYLKFKKFVSMWIMVCGIYSIFLNAIVEAQITVEKDYIQVENKAYEFIDENLNVDNYVKVFDRLYLKKDITDINIDITKIPRYEFGEFIWENYVTNIEKYFDTEDITIESVERKSDGSFDYEQNLGESRGSYIIKVIHSNIANTDKIKSFIYTLNPEYKKDNIVANLLYFDGIMFKDILTLSDNELQFASKADALKLLSDFVQKVFEYPDITVNKIKGLPANQLEAYIDNFNITNFTDNQEELYLDAEDLYLIDFNLAIENIPLANEVLIELGENQIESMVSGNAIVSKNGIEYISMANIVQPGTKLDPFSKTVSLEEMYQNLVNYLENNSVKPIDKELEFYIADLEIVYLPYNYNNYEMSMSPVWRVDIQIPFNVSNVGRDMQWVLGKTFYIDPLTGRMLLTYGF